MWGHSSFIYMGSLWEGWVVATAGIWCRSVLDPLPLMHIGLDGSPVLSKTMQRDNGPNIRRCHYLEGDWKPRKGGCSFLHVDDFIIAETIIGYWTADKQNKKNASERVKVLGRGTAKRLLGSSSYKILCRLFWQWEAKRSWLCLYSSFLIYPSSIHPSVHLSNHPSVHTCIHICMHQQQWI